MDGLDTTLEPDAPTGEWAERCRYWIERADATKPKRALRDREASPLILVGQGAYIKVDKGCLLVREGGTHFPQERREHRFFKGDLARPPRIVLVDGSGSVTFDALDWLAEQSVSLIRLKWDGSVMIAVNATGYAADREKVDWQRATAADPKKRLAFAIDLITRKLKDGLITLETCFPDTQRRARAIVKIQAVLDEIAAGRARSVLDLTGLEGKAAAAYFDAWRDMEIKWKATKRHPIPDHWRSFTSRSSLSDRKRRNNHATHPVNAMLNYAYAMAQTQLHIQAVSQGYDPTLGILHSVVGERPSYILDLVEPIRPHVEARVLQLIASETFSGADFLVQRDGVVRLGPAIAKLKA